MKAMGKRDAPVCNKKIKEMVGFREEFPWRKVMGRDGGKAQKEK